MLDVKTWIRGKLIANTTLTNLLGSASKIVFFYPTDFSVLPVLAYETYTLREDGFADDTNFAETWDVVLHTWVSNGDAHDIVNAADAVMVANGFTLDGGEDVPDPTANIRHYRASYRRKISADDLIV